MHIPGTDHTVYITEPCRECERARTNNPDPEKWSLVRHHESNGYLAMWVAYENIPSDRFEKHKVMVVKANIADFLKNKSLDPHFAKDGIIMARFRPTDEGWDDAVKYLLAHSPAPKRIVNRQISHGIDGR